MPIVIDEVLGEVEREREPDDARRPAPGQAAKPPREVAEQQWGRDMRQHQRRLRRLRAD